MKIDCKKGAAISYYNGQSEGLGYDFSAEVERDLIFFMVMANCGRPTKCRCYFII